MIYVYMQYYNQRFRCTLRGVLNTSVFFYTPFLILPLWHTNGFTLRNILDVKIFGPSHPQFFATWNFPPDRLWARIYSESKYILIFHFINILNFIILINYIIDNNIYFILFYFILFYFILLIIRARIYIVKYSEPFGQKENVPERNLSRARPKRF